ncbi:glycosyltransferase [Actinoplanes derwentensis]|uniref:4,4'-diaponeurosporenoate glycosyltransferase n=1 Tax=Actinoplanes derwentensis TaxID=113562 RepID=A0A1H1ZF20_9ACTN|nr:glycosyltransferase [Actinoplanes derwentensis]GID82411.1 hypothetical protein Ade03nite_13350 [Actinoplanes derwentensis]SDT32381.1 Glycosyl transferase family 2 [Actinoplanes derwentensis]
MTGISIVVPTLNEQRYIGQLLASLEGQAHPPPFEVIVVDSSDDELTRHAVVESKGSLDVAYERSLVKDIGAQRNHGAGQARYDLLLFSDADVVLAPGVLRECATAPVDEMFVGAIMHKADVDTRASRAGLAVIYALIRTASAVGVGVTNGDFLLTNRLTFDRAHGFQEGFLLGEDTDFGVRSCRLGARFILFSKEHVVASSRRLSQMSVPKLVAIWSRAFLRAVFRGPTPRSSRIDYPFGTWT